MTAKRAKTTRRAADDAEAPASATRPAARKASLGRTTSGAAVRGAKASAKPSGKSAPGKSVQGKSTPGKSTPGKRAPGKTAAKKQLPGTRVGSAAGAAVADRKSAAGKPRPATPSARARSRAKKGATPGVVSVVESALDEMKAVNVKRLDVQGLTDITDTMIIASGNSDRHVRSIADRIVERAKNAGFRPMGVEGGRDGEWVLVDLQDVIVHVMLPRVREFYRLESLWDVSAARRNAASQSA